MMPKGNQSAQKREPKRARDLQKGALRKSFVFFIAGPGFPRTILGAKSPTGWTSLLPDHTFGPCKMYAFTVVLIGFEQTGRLVEI